MYLLDSNILIGHLNGDLTIKNWIKDNLNSKSLYISVISEVEILSFPGLEGESLYEVEKFMELFNKIDLFGNIPSMAASLKRRTNLSLADAIIMATAISRRLTLVTNDKILIKKVRNFVDVLSLNKKIT